MGYMDKTPTWTKHNHGQNTYLDRISTFENVDKISNWQKHQPLNIFHRYVKILKYIIKSSIKVQKYIFLYENNIYIDALII